MVYSMSTYNQGKVLNVAAYHSNFSQEGQLLNILLGHAHFYDHTYFGAVAPPAPMLATGLYHAPKYDCLCDLKLLV